MWKNNCLDETRKALLEQNVIELGGDVDREMALYVREALLRLIAKGAPPIKVIITSEGGNLGFGLDIYDALRLYPGEKEGIVLGCAKSMAAVILQACQKRKIARHGHLLIHHVLRMEPTSLAIFSSKKEVAKIIRDLGKSQEKIYQVLKARTKKTLAAIKRQCKKADHMTAQEALAFGLVDEIF